MTVSSEMEEIQPPITAAQRLKVAILPLDLACSGFVTYSGEIITTGTNHKTKPDGFFPKESQVGRTSGCVRLEGVKKWPNSMIATL
jgi:hypothetical protein